MRSILVACLVVLPLAAPMAQTMQVSARPVSGTIEARADRAPTMVDFAVRAVEDSGMDDCYGMVDRSAPDVVLDWRGGDLKLYTRASADATLLVYGPDQTWHCDDDTEGLAPVVSIDGAARGRYVVWVGSISQDLEDAQVTLVAGRPEPAQAPNPEGRPVAGRIDVRGGFEANNGPIEMSVPAGGLDALSSIELDLGDNAMFGCPGFISAATPTATLAYTAGGPSTLAIHAMADPDLALLVQSPSGAWSCNDDFDGLNPMVSFEDAESGRYAIWVATYSSHARGATVNATLLISEDVPERPEYDDMDLDMDEMMGGTPYSTGTYSPLEINGTPHRRLALDGDDAVEADLSITPTSANPVRGDVCNGMIEPSPTVALRISGDGPVAISATADPDLVMNVRTPSGNWFCSDDANGLNPGVQLDDIERGDYLIWVGTFADMGDESTDVQLSVTRGELEVTTGGGGGSTIGQGFDPYEEGSYSGAELSTSRPGAMLSLSNGEAETRVQAGGPVLNPVDADACQGFITANPTAAVSVSAGDSIAIAASADEDLTMVVQTPDGRWFCSDDADGSDPQVMLDLDASGTVSIWVGTFSMLTNRPTATLTVSQ